MDYFEIIRIAINIEITRLKKILKNVPTYSLIVPTGVSTSDILPSTENFMKELC
ncbi:8324_t:CDS:2 [Funneliformis caledonium]|uniref:8324_t:CDS:1 n=1 Tax=Funneliformis caledonium TaxID=1117310 RepID=A0A9N9C915_9GLOM|nr:8324_t:CDS:2 [Funneliformis caledonium]